MTQEEAALREAEGAGQRASTEAATSSTAEALQTNGKEDHPETPFRFLPTRSRAASVGVAVCAVLAALWVQTWLASLGARLVYLTFYPCVSIAAIVGGFRAGALATVLSAAIAYFRIAPPVESADWIGLATFLWSCALVIGVTEAMHRATERVANAEERAKFQAAIQANEARLRLFIDHAPAAVAMFDHDMRYLLASERWRASYGLGERDLHGVCHCELFPQTPERWREIHHRALKGETSSAEEERFERADGRTQWVRWEALPWRDAAGTIAGVVIFAEDITARKEAEVALKDSEDRLLAVFEAATDAILTIDENGVMASVNPAAARMFGYETSELVGQNVNMLMPEPEHSRHDGYLQHYLKTGEARIIGRGREAEAVRKDRTPVPVELAVGEIRDGGPRMFVGIVRDVTERRRARERQQALVEELRLSEAEARQRQALFRSIFDSAPEGIVLTDMQGLIVMANPALQRMFGFGTEELHRASASKLFADFREWERIHAASVAADAAAAVGPQAVDCMRRDGGSFPAEIIKAPYLDSAGERLGSLSIIRDVTWERKQEEELRQAQRLEALSQLTGGIAHDFNNLLTVISGNLQILEMKVRDEALSTYLGKAERAVRMGVRLNQRLMTFARQRSLQPAPANLSDQVAGLLELLHRSLGEQVTVQTNLAKSLWPTLVDASEIENAILNLAINARDAMPNGGRLIVETENVVVNERAPEAREELPPGAYVRLSVSDTGTGMTPDVLARAFEPFFTTKEPGKGTGLGLASIYGFVKQSGGHVTLYSEVGRGTTVNIYLPKAEGSEAALPAPAPAAPASLLHGGGEAILVVEDNPDVRRVTVERLEILGYKVLEAEDAMSALAILDRGNQIDLVFSDVVMPGGMSGFELAHRIRETRPLQRLLLTSGFTGEVAQSGEPPVRGIQVLRKPYDQAGLADAIRVALRG